MLFSTQITASTGLRGLYMLKRFVTLSRNEEISLEDGSTYFMNSRRARGLSEETIRYYTDNVKRFCEFVGWKTLCIEICEEHIFEYINYMREELAVKLTTVNTRLRAVRCFLYSLMKKGFIEKFDIALIRAPKEPIEIYTDAEIESLLEKPVTESFAQYRNWVMVCHLLATGNRLGTIVNIKVGDVLFHRGEILLTHVKNKAQYRIPIPAGYQQILEEYLELYDGGEDDYLFPSVYGGAMSKNTFEDAINTYNAGRGVHRKRQVHLYRHTFATKWLLNGGDALRLQEMLGHKTPAMVQEYVHFTSTDLKRDLEKHNPFSVAITLKEEKQTQRKAMRLKRAPA